MEQEHDRNQLSSPSTNVATSLQEVARQVADELRRLLEMRAEVTRRIGTLKKTAAGLASTFGTNMLNEDFSETLEVSGPNRRKGLTDKCREILIQSDSPLTSRDVCEILLKEAPVVLANHKDPVASVTTVLNRLVEYGEVRRVALSDDKRAWQWVTEGETGL
jgi:hypothetical protein